MILVTGANGFIGSAIVWQLNQSGMNDIVCVDTVSLEERPYPLAKRQFAKFLSEKQLWDYLTLPETQKKVDWIIHMGANSSTTETNWQHLYENNTFYTQRIFEWCAEHGKNLVYASSAATYGAGELGYSDSTDSEQLKPLNLYGNSKVLFDRWVVRQSKTPPSWYGLKFFNVYGPNEYHKGAMASLVFKAFHQVQQTGQLKLFKSYVPQFKNGEQMRDFVYVKDVTEWILELMRVRPQSGIYNMGFGQARTWLNLAEPLFSSLGQAVKIDYIDMPENIRNQYQYFTEADMSKWFGQKLSKPRWSVQDGVSDYVQNYLLKADSTL
jgi:ADP-L-glycero-D-manno-heptose 6-epimerase